MKKIFKYLFFGLLVFNFSFRANGQNITSAEYFFGSSDPGPGSATPLSVLDGNFDFAMIRKPVVLPDEGFLYFSDMSGQ